MPRQFVRLLEYHISDRYFGVVQKDAHSEQKEMNVGVPQDRELGPLLYLIFTSDFTEIYQKQSQILHIIE